jgi:hypothetical protein
MVVGILQFELFVHGAQSLKDKRRVVSSVKDRLHRGHQVAVAEVAAQETLNLAVLGRAAGGSDGRHIGQVLDRITAELRALPDAELGATSRSILSGHASEIGAPEDDGADLAAEMLARAGGGVRSGGAAP